MRTVIILLLFPLLTSAQVISDDSTVQSTKPEETLIGIEGKLTHIRQAQDDISFYTWSLYLTIELENGWSYLLDSTEKPNIDSLWKYCDNFSENTLRFNYSGFYNEKMIKEFMGNVKKGNQVIIYVSKYALERFLNEHKCMISMESIQKRKKK